MAYALSNTSTGALALGALTPEEKSKLQSALDRVSQAASGQGFNLGSNPAMNVRQNPGIAVGPSPSLAGPSRSLALQGALSLAGGFGPGPLGALNIAQTAINPSSFTDTGMTNIPGLGTIATKPGPIGPLLSMTGFGGLASAAGALNAANLQRIAATDPNATFASGAGWGGAFSNGTYSGTLPGGLEAAQRRAMISAIAQEHYDRQHNSESHFGGGDRDPRSGAKGSARSGGGYRAE